MLVQKEFDDEQGQKGAIKTAEEDLDILRIVKKLGLGLMIDV